MQGFPCHCGPNFQRRIRISVLPFKVLHTWKHGGDEFAVTAPGKLESHFVSFVFLPSLAPDSSSESPEKMTAWSTWELQLQFGTRRRGLCGRPALFTWALLLAGPPSAGPGLWAYPQCCLPELCTRHILSTPTHKPLSWQWCQDISEPSISEFLPSPIRNLYEE